MNVVFELPSKELEAQFLADSLDAGFSGLAGHRAVGGIRASIYNALQLSAVDQLLEFMQTFQRKNRH
jgi:phosphoserine aminotransferase